MGQLFSRLRKKKNDQQNGQNRTGVNEPMQAPPTEPQHYGTVAAKKPNQNERVGTSPPPQPTAGIAPIPSVHKPQSASPPTPTYSESAPASPAAPTYGAPNFTKVTLLGKGAQGQVWKAQMPNTPPDEFVVVKEMMFTDRKKWERVKTQALAVKALRHNHLIQYVDVFAGERPLSISVVMPFYKEKDMLNYLNSVNLSKKTIPEYVLCSLILQVAKALLYLHTRNPPMIHRDVKPENILMFDNYQRTLLMDLDMSRELPTANAAVTRVGTPEYMCPEGLRGSPQTPKSDIWSLGACFLVLGILPSSLKLPNPRTGQPALYNSDTWTPQDLDNAITQTLDNRTTSRRAKPYSNKMKRLIQEMMRHDPNQRPDAEYVIARFEEICTDCLLNISS